MTPQQAAAHAFLLTRSIVGYTAQRLPGTPKELTRWLNTHHITAALWSDWGSGESVMPLSVMILLSEGLKMPLARLISEARALVQA